MNCDEARPLIAAYADGELDLTRSIELEQHVASCANCSAVLANLRALRSGIAAARFAAPSDLRKNALRSISRKSRTHSINRSWLLQGLALAAALVIGFFIGQTLIHRSPDRALLAQLTDDHIRSLAGTHLTDIVSTDQHTVRPWFEGKLDFAPPVEDLSSAGFPLVGGRLEYVNGRAVAALVYQRRKHFINLFIWPARETRGIQTEPPQRGYNIVHWQNGGMNLWAVSEVNESELRDFAGRFAAAVSR